MVLFAEQKGARIVELEELNRSLMARIFDLERVEQMLSRPPS